MESECVRDDGLDDVAVTHDAVDRIRPEKSVPVTDTGDGAMLHGGHGFSLGEYGSARMRLHDLPEGIPCEALEGLTCPGSVVALPHTIVHVTGDRVATAQDDVGSLLGALEG